MARSATEGSDLPDIDEHPAAFPRLTQPQLDEIAAYGEEQTLVAGEELFRAGEESLDFYVVLDGEVEIVRPDGDDLIPVVVFDRHHFVGELQLLTGQRRFLTGRMRTDGRLFVVRPSEFRRLMSSSPALADWIFSAMFARREVLRSGEAARSIRIIGSRYSPEATALRAYATHAHLPFEWQDLEDDADIDATLAGIGVTRADTPLVITASGTMRRPSPGEFAEQLGLTYRPTPGFIFDLIVVGSGPAGLAASVYGASEGLRTISMDLVGVGGQAGASSRIENYAGFPLGISGDELASRTAIQAQRLGATLNSPCEVVGLEVREGFHVVKLADGSDVPCRAVIVASGARYQRLPIDELDRFEGAGFYYAATDLEARVCNGRPVVVVGGGNSAGQAAIYLAQQGSTVSIVIRRKDLRASMSSYLIDRIEADDRILLHTCTEIRGLAGAPHLEQVVVEHTDTGERESLPCSGVFCFIGAVPATAWLDGAVVLDDKGFILTDRSLPASVTDSPTFGGREPLPFETSVPGVFAVGDVRNGSLKRVAAAVGEGSSAVRSVHDHLAATVS